MMAKTKRRTETFALPWPPSANTSKIPVRSRMVSTPKLRKYHADAIKAIKALNLKPMDPPYTIHLEFQEPDRRARDLPNFEKAPVDVMVKSGLLRDDCWIDDYRLTRTRGTVTKGGQIIVTIKELV